MPQRTTTIRIAQPCAESWAAMAPAGSGRHCAACQKTVVDFTLKSDAEILAYFQQAGAGAACGRFRAGQLARPLRPTAHPRLAQRWRGWAAAALALWGLRAEATTPPAAGPPSAQHSPRRPAPAPPTRQVARRLVSGVVRDQHSQEPVAQAKVRLKGGHRTATTDANGYFRLWLPARRGPHTQPTLLVQQVGYVARTVRVPLAARSARAVRITLAPETESVPPEPIYIGGYESGVPITVTVDARQDSVAPAGAAGQARRSWYQRFTQPFRRHSAR